MFLISYVRYRTYEISHLDYAENGHAENAEWLFMAWSRKAAENPE
jgi:hypothetical protein